MARLTAHRIHNGGNSLPEWKQKRIIDGFNSWDAAREARMDALSRHLLEGLFAEAGQFAAEVALTLSESYRRRMVKAERWNLAWSILFTLQCMAVMGMLWLAGR